MCDCSVEENNENAFEAETMRTVMIFEKCSKLPVQRADYADESLEGARRKQHIVNKKLVIPTVSSTKSSSGKYFNDSIQTHKFMNQRNSECPIGCEDTKYDAKCNFNAESSEEQLDVQYTLALIKPETIGNLNAIENIIFEEGFELVQTKCLQMTSEQVSEFFADSYGTVNFTHFVTYVASSPIVVTILAKKEMVQRWRLLKGPTKVTEARLYFPDSVRSQHGRMGVHYKNSDHPRATREQAEREIHFFFPEVVFEPLLEGINAENYLRDVIGSFLGEGLAACCKVKPVEPILWLANWLLSNNPSVPKIILKDASE